MKYKILFHPEAAREIGNLDNRQKILVLKQINKLVLTPGRGKLLGNKQGINLSGYRKLYVDSIYKEHSKYIAKTRSPIFAMHNYLL